MRKKLSLRLSLLFTVLCFTQLTAQDQFERLYRANDLDHIALDVVQTADDGYLVLSIADSLNMRLRANVLRLDNKGNMVWTKDYEFEHQLDITGNLQLLENDTFAFIVTERDGDMNKIVTLASAGGEVVWSKSYGEAGEVNQAFFGYSRISTNYDGGFGLIGQTYEGLDRDLYLARLDSIGALIWAKEFQATILEDQLVSMDIRSTPDSGFIATGSIETGFLANIDAFLLKLDSLGNVEWSRRYGIDSPFDIDRANVVIPAPDGGYIVGGSEVVGDLPALLNATVFKTDSLGIIEWKVSINVDDSFTTIGNTVNVVISPNNEIVISGSAINNITDDRDAFLVALDMAGNKIWDRRFKRIVNDAFLNDGLALTSDDGFINIVTGADENANDPIPYLIKTDAMGISSCEDTLVAVYTLFDEFATDTLILTETNIDTILTVEPIVETYNGYSLPILILNQPPPFCEGDPILWTFDATIDGAVSYEWSTGETTPMITVMEEGQYTVQVRMEEDYCFTLCDTAMISVIGPPTVEINPILDIFCTQGFGTLLAEVQGNPNTIAWSNGESSVPSINIEDSGTYSVTVTNQCGEGVNSFSFNDFPQILPEPNISIQENNICTGGTAVLSGTANSANSIEWSTGETTPNIEVAETGAYSLTATNMCGDVTVSINLDNEEPTGTVTIFENCETDSAILIVTSPNATSFTFEGIMYTAFPDTFLITGQGTYDFNLINGCGETPLPATFNCISLIDDCVRIPNAFTPNGDQTNNDFGAVVLPDCGNEFTILNFLIFNRWGQKVFETKGDQRWDGTHNGDPATADVYLYLIEVESEDDDLPKTFKGDVTLIR